MKLVHLDILQLHKKLPFMNQESRLMSEPKTPLSTGSLEKLMGSAVPVEGSLMLFSRALGK